MAPGFNLRIVKPPGRSAPASHYSIAGIEWTRGLLAPKLRALRPVGPLGEDFMKCLGVWLSSEKAPFGASWLAGRDFRAK